MSMCVVVSLREGNRKCQFDLPSLSHSHTCSHTHCIRITVAAREVLLGIGFDSHSSSSELTNTHKRGSIHTPNITRTNTHTREFPCTPAHSPLLRVKCCLDGYKPWISCTMASIPARASAAAAAVVSPVWWMCVELCEREGEEEEERGRGRGRERERVYACCIAVYACM